MPLGRYQRQSGSDTRVPVEPEQLAPSWRRSFSRPPSSIGSFSRPPPVPPPYEERPTPDVSCHPPLSPRSPSRAASPPRHQPRSPPFSRRTPPDPRVVTVTSLEEGTATPIRPASSPSSSSQAFTPPQSSQSHVNNSSQPLFVPPNPQTSRSRLVFKFRPFLMLKLPKATRNATAQIAKQAVWKVNEDLRLQKEEEEAARQAAEQAVREREAADARRAAAEAEARGTVQHCIHSLLSHSHPSAEDRSATLWECFQACENGGLDFSAVIQEPLIAEQTPVYWAILKRRATSSEVDSAAFDALIVALLRTCRSFNETTMASVRVACMLTSNNALLQHLFSQFPGLSPLPPGDGLLLGPSGRGGVINVEETRDGTGAFVAYIEIPRFRLRVRVSKVVNVEFVTSGRIWVATFTMSTEHPPEGPPESRWQFSLQLAHNSPPTCVNADLLIPGRSNQSDDSDNNEPIFNVPVGCGGHGLRSGPEHEIKVRLDDGPMGLHWINESSALTDANETLHAKLHVRLTHPQAVVPPVPPLGPNNSDAGSSPPGWLSWAW